MAIINKNMTIHEVMQLCPNIVPVFNEFNMRCLGCPMARGETIEQAAVTHGVDLELMLKKLNDFASKI